MAKTTIFVNDATTEPSIQRIEHILCSLEGMERVIIDTDDGEVKIEFDDEEISTEHITSVLMEHNFILS